MPALLQLAPCDKKGVFKGLRQSGRSLAHASCGLARFRHAPLHCKGGNSLVPELERLHGVSKP